MRSGSAAPRGAPRSPGVVVHHSFPDQPSVSRWCLQEVNGDMGNKEPAADFVGPYRCNYLDILVVRSQSEDSSSCRRAKAENASSGDLAGFPGSGVQSDMFKGPRGVDRLGSQEDSLGAAGKGVKADTSPSRADDVWGREEKSQRGSLQCPSCGEHEVVGVQLLPGGARR